MWLPEWSAEAAVHALALLARREEDLGLVLVEVVLVPSVAPRYDLRRAHPLADGDLKSKLGPTYSLITSFINLYLSQISRHFDSSVKSQGIRYLCHLPEGVDAGAAALSHGLPRREPHLHLLTPIV